MFSWMALPKERRTGYSEVDLTVFDVGLCEDVWELGTQIAGDGVSVA